MDQYTINPILIIRHKATLSVSCSSPRSSSSTTTKKRHSSSSSVEFSNFLVESLPQYCRNISHREGNP
ncbi:hypothetical protein Peur_049940 [Populus x canadensis]